MSIQPIDESKLLQTITGFSLAILLSLCSRIATGMPDQGSSINIALWMACGLFASASIRFLDKAYDDHFDAELGILSINSKTGLKYLISVDARWFRSSFALSMAGWLFFLIAYFHIAAVIFSAQGGNDLYAIFSVANINWHTRIMFLLITYTTARTATKQFLFHE